MRAARYNCAADPNNGEEIMNAKRFTGLLMVVAVVAMTASQAQDDSMAPTVVEGRADDDGNGTEVLGADDRGWRVGGER